tara:strand:- start:883 stop:1569 length:687 start_codon:yes stop_codon:yes gene_type:complete
MKKGLSLIIPAYKAEGFIEDSLTEYFKNFSNKFDPLEVIVVCNACKKTYEKVLSLKDKFPIIILNTTRRGKGNAIIQGLKVAKNEIVGFLDADDPYDLESVIKMIEDLDKLDLVIVTKFKKGTKYQTSITRRFFSICGAIIFRFLFGFHFEDTQAGAKFMRRDLLRKFKKPFMCTGFEFDMELLYEASKAKAAIGEYYIPPNEVDYSTVKMRILPGLVYRLLKMRLIK